MAVYCNHCSRDVFLLLLSFHKHVDNCDNATGTNDRSNKMSAVDWGMLGNFASKKSKSLGQRQTFNELSVKFSMFCQTDRGVVLIFIFFVCVIDNFFDKFQLIIQHCRNADSVF